MAFIICTIGVILPWRLRCLYSELLGWITQFIYLNYITILKFMINELEKAKIQTEKK
jgi:hypothetical protein